LCNILNIWKCCTVDQIDQTVSMDMQHHIHPFTYLNLFFGSTLGRDLMTLHSTWIVKNQSIATLFGMGLGLNG
jgi:hypothetical protein